MRSFSLVATAAAVAGAALLGASLGGMRHVDAELAHAARPAPMVRFDQVDFRPGATRRFDCPRDARRRVAHASRPEL